jgi:threonylcarbamoyladenosine tRNA methylthiotransferase MtaB
LKVQDGCNYKCSFCTIPKARGASRSNTIESIVLNAQEIASMGIKEIVLTGVNIGDFGNGTEVIEGLRPKKEAMFIDLIKALDEVEGIERFRISSIEPNLLTTEIIEFVAQSKRFAPHFHIPLQSGNDKQLKQMRRRYRRSLYAERVATIKKLIPHCCIGVDVIVGFPGETDEDFKETCRFIQDLDISYLHVFTYSERANTPAATMPNVLPVHQRRERNEILRLLSDKKRRAFYNNYLQTNQKVLVEAKQIQGKMVGFTENYIKVALDYDDSLVNSITDVQLNQMMYNYDEAVVEAQLI